MGEGVEEMGGITSTSHAMFQHARLWRKSHGSGGEKLEVGGAGVGETGQALGIRTT